MNKGGRTAVFILLATVGNLLLTAVFFVGLLLLYGLTLGRVMQPGPFALLGAFVIAVILTVVVYSAVLKGLRKRYDFEKLMGFKK